MDTKQPEAIRIAEWLEGIRGNTWPSYIPQEAAAELRRQHVENETLRAGYDAARLEIGSLKERVQQLGQLARDVNSRRVMELEARLEAVGTGGVEPLRKRCLHQISEPAKAGWCDGCSPDNCGGCASSAAPAPASHPVAMPEPHYGKGRYLGFARHNDAYSVAQVQAMLAAVPRNATLYNPDDVAFPVQRCADGTDAPPELSSIAKQAFIAAAAATSVPIKAGEYPELPERPEPDGFLTIKIIGRNVEINAYRDSTMEAYAYASIDADRAARGAAQSAPIDAAVQQESPYDRGFRHGYNCRDAEVRGALL